MVDHSQSAPDTEPRRHGRLIALMTVGGMMGTVGFLSPEALFVVLGDGLVALGIVAAAAGLGMWLILAIGLHKTERRWQLIMAVALGLGAISLLVLSLGVLGILGRSLWFALLLLFAVAGLVRIKGLHGQPDEDSDTADSRLSWLWLTVIGFGALALLGGTMPPGFLWADEGHGYDVLEYHLGAPREYYDAGQISYLPHNIYSNFPFNVEMLYLLSMVLHGDAVTAAYTAKLLNVLLALLTVGGVWLAGREFGSGSGIVAGLSAATCPFLTYLCGVAYVENGLLFYAAMSLASILRAFRDPTQSGRWSLASGLFCGLACGCKYTAVPAVALPLFIVVAFQAIRRRPISARLVLPFCLGGLITFGPWLVKNVVATGNPVFPLAYNFLGADDGIWNDDGAARWHEGHLPDPKHRAIGERLSRFWSQVIVKKRYGPIVGIGLITGIVLSGIARFRRPQGSPKNERLHRQCLGVCLCMCAAGIVWWLAFSHLVDRFATILVVPCSILLGQAWCFLRLSSLKGFAAVLLIACIGANLRTTWSWFADPNALGPDLEESYLDLNVFGQTAVLTESPNIKRRNEILAANQKLLMVGDARRFYFNPGVDYCVVFNRNPFAEAAEALSPTELLEWLRHRRYAYVYVDWSEMHRLRNSRYGFWKSVTANLFNDLRNAGLTPIENFSFSEDGRPYATLFAVP
ncbi:MAG: hypothetical protein MI923_16645 [Phycisphaerales bacterium]|nr:hypothetical protein [Phycisphaerales bacterium]